MNAVDAPATAAACDPDPSSAAVAAALAEPDVARVREALDDIDDVIATAVTQRAALTALLQAARVRAGRPRVDLQRERRVIARYSSQLGTRGAALAEAVLDCCRREVDNALSARTPRQ